MQITTLLKPHFISLLKIFDRRNLSKELFQNSIVLAFCLFLAGAMYVGTRQALIELDSSSRLIVLPTHQLLGLFLTILFVTLILSNLAISLGRLYQSNDTDLILSSPVSFPCLFFTRFIQTFLSASWMPTIFLVPVLLAICERHDAEPLSFLYLLPVFFCFFVIPSGFSTVLSTLLLYLSPANYVRYILLTLFLVVSLVFWNIHHVLTQDSVSLTTSSGIAKVLALMSIHSLSWLPSNWAAKEVEKIATNNFFVLDPEMILLVSLSFISVCLAYCVFIILFDEANSRATSSLLKKKSIFASRLRGLVKFLPLPAQSRAIIIKEYQVLFRDTAQLVQIILLVILSTLYLYNLETLAFASQFSEKFKLNWTTFMIVTSISIGCFFIVAIATRMVFPSISLEGGAFFNIETAPIHYKRYLRIKFWTWFIPIAFLALIYFALAGVAIRLNTLMVIGVSLFGLFCAYIAVGLATGLGARFSRFDWEYSTQLAASFGSVFYMLSTIVTIGLSSISLLPVLFLTRAEHSSSPILILCCLVGVFISALPAVYLVRSSFALGIKELEKRRERL